MEKSKCLIFEILIRDLPSTNILFNKVGLQMIKLATL